MSGKYLAHSLATIDKEHVTGSRRQMAMRGILVTLAIGPEQGLPEEVSEGVHTKREFSIQGVPKAWKDTLASLVQPANAELSKGPEVDLWCGVLLLCSTGEINNFLTAGNFESQGVDLTDPEQLAHAWSTSSKDRRWLNKTLALIKRHLRQHETALQLFEHIQRLDLITDLQLTDASGELNMSVDGISSPGGDRRRKAMHIVDDWLMMMLNMGHGEPAPSDILVDNDHIFAFLYMVLQLDPKGSRSAGDWQECLQAVTSKYTPSPMLSRGEEIIQKNLIWTLLKGPHSNTTSNYLKKALAEMIDPVIKEVIDAKVEVSGGAAEADIESARGVIAIMSQSNASEVVEEDNLSQGQQWTELDSLVAVDRPREVESGVNKLFHRLSAALTQRGVKTTEDLLTALRIYAGLELAARDHLRVQLASALKKSNLFLGHALEGNMLDDDLAQAWESIEELGKIVALRAFEKLKSWSASLGSQPHFQSGQAGLCPDALQSDQVNKILRYTVLAAEDPETQQQAFDLLLSHEDPLFAEVAFLASGDRQAPVLERIFYLISDRDAFRQEVGAEVRSLAAPRLLGTLNFPRGDSSYVVRMSQALRLLDRKFEVSNADKLVKAYVPQSLCKGRRQEIVEDFKKSGYFATASALEMGLIRSPEYKLSNLQREAAANARSELKAFVLKANESGLRLTPEEELRGLKLIFHAMGEAEYFSFVPLDTLQIDISNQMTFYALPLLLRLDPSMAHYWERRIMQTHPDEVSSLKTEIYQRFEELPQQFEMRLLEPFRRSFFRLKAALKVTAFQITELEPSLKGFLQSSAPSEMKMTYCDIFNMVKLAVLKEPFQDESYSRIREILKTQGHDDLLIALDEGLIGRDILSETVSDEATAASKIGKPVALRAFEELKSWSSSLGSQPHFQSGQSGLCPDALQSDQVNKILRYTVLAAEDSETQQQAFDLLLSHEDPLFAEVAFLASGDRQAPVLEKIFNLISDRDAFRQEVGARVRSLAAPRLLGTPDYPQGDSSSIVRMSQALRLLDRKFEVSNADKLVEAYVSQSICKRRQDIVEDLKKCGYFATASALEMGLIRSPEYKLSVLQRKAAANARSELEAFVLKANESGLRLTPEEELRGLKLIFHAMGEAEYFSFVPLDTLQIDISNQMTFYALPLLLRLDPSMAHYWERRIMQTDPDEVSSLKTEIYQRFEELPQQFEMRLLEPFRRSFFRLKAALKVTAFQITELEPSLKGFLQSSAPSEMKMTYCDIFNMVKLAVLKEPFQDESYSRIREVLKTQGHDDLLNALDKGLIGPEILRGTVSDEATAASKLQSIRKSLGSHEDETSPPKTRRLDL